MRKLPQIGPLIVPTVLDTLFANVGHWFSGLAPLALLVVLILVPVWLSSSKRFADVSPLGRSSVSKNLSLESSPYAVPTGPATADEKRTVGAAAGPLSSAVWNPADAAPPKPRDD